MSRNDIDQAKEWAKESVYFDDSSGFASAVRVIQSLPDQIIDAEKVRWILHKYAYMHATGLQAANILNDLEALLTPSLPTLTELIEQGNDPQSYQWMQCTVEGRGDDTFVIASVRELVTKVLLPDGMHEVKGNSQVTPLPDLPKLEWPGSHADTITAESVEDMQAGRVADFEPAPTRPEDVPAGEPWIVQHYGEEWAGVRANEDRGPWHIISMDGLDYQDVDDSEITLVSRLVPEVAL